MGTAEIKVFFITICIVIAALIIGIITYVIQYRQRRLLDIAEKETILQQHQLDLLTAQIISQRETAEHIGREIHDSVTQKLTLASIYLQKLKFDKKEIDPGSEITDINNILSNALMELRALSKDLTEDLMNNNSLESLIIDECENVNKSGMCTAQFKSDPVPELLIKAKTSFLRIIQEFLQNSLKHANCKNINIAIEIADEIMAVTIQDDGVGFELLNKEYTGIGLESIRRRVEIIGAASTLKSSPGLGTELTIKAPLKNITV
ncbi:MAG TPA: histidine kinase [Saprospiraceae bacterium]|nr:histidine kinase [Saprospiraceae bacterium]